MNRSLRPLVIVALRRRLSQDVGMVAVWVAVLAPVLFALSALAVDIARWYVEAATAQKAADAASLAGVTYLPQDLPTARSKALEAAQANVNAAACLSTNVTAGCVWTVTAEQGDRPSQLRVTVSTTVSNIFGAFVGNTSTTVSRVAMADYNGPAPMGSPCNTFGNEPAGTPGAPPVGSQRPVPGFADCASDPQFWGTIAGPNVFKTQGDQYNVRYCQGGESGCVGTTNSEFIPTGYFLIVRVVDRTRTGPIRLQVYDPAYVDTESRCTSLPTMPGNNMNPYATSDALTRYAATPNAFCTGDNNNSGLRVGNAVPTVTSFGLRRPSATLNPLTAVPETQCAPIQFPGYTTPTASQLQQYRTAGVPASGLNPNYNDALAKVFHQWVDICGAGGFTPSQNGDYYLQIRANVPLGDPNAIFTQVGDNTTVVSNGSNRFAVRAIASDGTAVSVAGWQRLPIFANADSANATFPLIRVLPGAAGKRIVFKFFDVGDAANAGSVQVRPPTDATVGTPPSTSPLTTLTGCTATGYQTFTSLTNCQINGISGTAGWNGQAETIVVPIPATYSCDYTSPGGCWFKVNFNFPGGQVTDQTTWTAQVTGDPVRLVQ